MNKSLLAAILDTGNPPQEYDYHASWKLRQAGLLTYNDSGLAWTEEGLKLYERIDKEVAGVPPDSDLIMQPRPDNWIIQLYKGAYASPTGIYVQSAVVDGVQWITDTTVLLAVNNHNPNYSSISESMVRKLLNKINPDSPALTIDKLILKRHMKDPVRAVKQMYGPLYVAAINGSLYNYHILRALESIYPGCTFHPVYQSKRVSTKAIAAFQNGNVVAVLANTVG